MNNWEGIDLTRPAAEIAAELGVHVRTVRRKKKEMGIESPVGRPQGSKRAKEDTQVVYLRLPCSIHSAARAAAKKNKVKLSAYLLEAIKDKLQQ